MMSLTKICVVWIVRSGSWFKETVNSCTKLGFDYNTEYFWL